VTIADLPTLKTFVANANFLARVYLSVLTVRGRATALNLQHRGSLCLCKEFPRVALHDGPCTLRREDAQSWA